MQYWGPAAVENIKLEAIKVASRQAGRFECRDKIHN
jgi:hypothetical protein